MDVGRESLIYLLIKNSQNIHTSLGALIAPSSPPFHTSLLPPLPPPSPPNHFSDSPPSGEDCARSMNIQAPNSLGLKYSITFIATEMI